LNGFIRDNKKNIYISVISSILFLYFFQPILDFIGAKTLIIMSLTSSKFSDDFHSKISHLELMDYSFYWISLIFICIGVAMGRIGVSGLFGLTQKEKVAEDTSKTKESTSKKVMFYLFCIIISLSLTFFISTKFYQLSLISSFKQHVRIIAPYISEQEEEVLISKWSLMKNSHDYEDINAALDKIAKQNNIILPSNKIYSVTTF